MTTISTTVAKNPLEEMKKALIVNKGVQNAVFGCKLKNDRMISVRFQALMPKKLKLKGSMKTYKTF